MRTALLILGFLMVIVAWHLTGTDNWFRNLAVVQLAWVGGILTGKYTPEWAKRS